MVFIKKIICILLVALLSFSITAVSAEEVGTEVALVTEEVIMPRLRLGARWRSCPCTITVENNWNSSYDTAINNAINTWNSVRDPNGNRLITFEFTYGTGDIQIRTGNLLDGTNAQCYFDGMDGDEFSYFDDLSDCAILMNDDDRYAIGAVNDKIDVQSLILHELGHCLGVAHCHENGDESCFSSTCSSNVMQPVLPRGVMRRSLVSYDTASYIIIYV